MKTLVSGLSLLGLGIVISLAASAPASAKTSGCVRITQPNGSPYTAVTVCRHSRLPEFFEAIGWQRIENKNINGATQNDAGQSASSPGDNCGYGGYGKWSRQ